MFKPTLRVGLAGLSPSDGRHLLPALAALDGRHAELVAVADAAPSSAQAQLGLLDSISGRRAALSDGHVVASRFVADDVTIHADAEAMVTEDDLDAIVIGSVDRPAVVAERALRCGRDVLLLSPDALADPAALLSLSALVDRYNKVFWPAHVTGLLRPTGTAAAPQLLGAVTGARATWDLRPSPRPEPTAPAQLVGLTAPLATLLDARSVECTDVEVTGRGARRSARVTWDTAAHHSAEAEVRLGWELGPHGGARVRLFGAGGARADLPLVAPDAAIEPTSRVLRGVLWHPAQGPLLLPPPRTFAVAHRAVLTEWVDACLARRPGRAPVPTALTAARMATDLAAALRQNR
ncbi:MAG TPA: hypothetical protein VFG42_09815 [Baekduia sp.]|uniref:hypothetical protein n=1 Tax=Baekduia sp. TaxID=2600305 RepID=UPI002D77B3FC|nr:hypothetical protein [Baekduia sp.]HET6507076.1 hypothetical protein [Baekduia sp.]